MRTGLLGASAAMAMGAVAVASGLVPGPGGLGGGQQNDRVQADSPSDLDDGGLPASVSPTPSKTDSRSESGRSADERDTASRDKERERPEKDESRGSESAKPTPSPSQSESSEESEGSSGRSESSSSPEGSGSSQGGGSQQAQPGSTKSAQTSDAQTAAETEVLQLVNQERAKAGCKPVTADTRLGALADDFSADMAKRGYFSHNSPDGQTPWDRADARGIDNLGGENIARGQANAQSVMDSWMNSPGHKANILNCDYRTLGVSAHFGEGGPWWVQEFGF
ncbi:CAP domain-containing protein [Streptomyces sulphureus]|uniref:CAP domain-containing protein n=1 Tax=Streptomyces sulphureus TaxID=47758 RepID=UPI00036EAAA9|nr:CAP domain-containing protein [Streptomyces sulphureus]